MNIVSQSLCKTLWELSGWVETPTLPPGMYTIAGKDARLTGKVEPFYTLGYLLRKLPPYFEESRVHWLELSKSNGKSAWACGYHGLSIDRAEWADTPEDAACKLAIELFKSGVLKR